MIEFFKDLVAGVFISILIGFVFLLVGGLFYYLPAWVTISFIFGAFVWLIGAAFRNME